MKVSKKLLSMVLCGVITFGGVQALSLKKVDAFQEPLKWSVPIRIKLRAVHNYFYKQWRQINLDCTKDNILQLRKSTNIPSNMTFDDDYVIGINNIDYLGVTEYPFFVLANESNADRRLQKEINDFNRRHYKVGCQLFIHGTGWDDTLTLPSKMYLYQSSNNDYASGYKRRNRWKSGFNTADNGLYECTFMHAYDEQDLFKNMNAEERSRGI